MGVALATGCFLFWWTQVENRSLSELHEKPTIVVAVEDESDSPNLADMYLTPPVDWQPTLDHNDIGVRAAFTQLLIRRACTEMSAQIFALRGLDVHGEPNGVGDPNEVVNFDE